jgi:hypothetical protein
MFESMIIKFDDLLALMSLNPEYAFIIFAIIMFFHFIEELPTATAIVSAIGVFLIWQLFAPDLSPYYLLLYLPIGIAWTTVRWFVHCKIIVDSALKYQMLTEDIHVPFHFTKESVEARISTDGNKNMLITWIFGWPAGMASVLVYLAFLLSKILVCSVFSYTNKLLMLAVSSSNENAETLK